MRLVLFAVVIGLLGALAGCGDDSHPPFSGGVPPPPVGGFATPVPEDAGVPDQAVVPSDQAVVVPDQAVVVPDQAVVVPDQTVVVPDQTVVVPDMTAAPDA